MQRILRSALVLAIAGSFLVVSAPSGAAVPEVIGCRVLKGALGFFPALEMNGSAASHVTTLKTVNAQMQGCTGRQGLLAKVSFSVRTKAAVNCTSMSTNGYTATGTGTITFNKGDKSTIKLTLAGKSGGAWLKPTINGSVTAGYLKNHGVLASLLATLPAGACATKPAKASNYTLAKNTRFVFTKAAHAPS